MFPLFKLPSLAAEEVCKSMSIEELLCASFASKKTRRLVKSSIPKGSLWFEFRIAHALDVRCKKNFLLVNLVDEPGTVSHRVGFPQRKNMIKHIVETFNNPKVSLECLFNADENFILEIIQHFKTCHLDIQEIKIRQDVSRETFTQILNECTDVYKLQFFFRRSFELQPDIINAFFKKVLSTDCKMENFHIYCDASQEFPRIVEGLVNGPIQADNSVIVQKTDGTKLKIKWDKSSIEMKRVKHV